MEAPTFFLHLMLILLAARLFGELAVRLKAPAVLGELLARVVVRPSLLGWLEVTEVIKLIRSGGRSALVAVAGFPLPFVFGFGRGYWGFGPDLLVALFAGGTLTATRIGSTVRALTDLKRQDSLEGRVVLGAAVLDDILVAPLALKVLYRDRSAGASRA